ncbi:MAG TPA: FkbM family methyltransferase [Tepidisphaeraceae bacterium]|nr:FkbM family methyltransferase [Tepidisphaeraceae bacterium]
MTPDDFDIINYPYVLPDKKPKRICVPKQQNVIGTLIKTARPWEYGQVIDLYTAVGKGGSFVEVGANIGSDTILACDFFKMCYCFEPLAEHVALIQKTLELNQVTNVQVFPFAVSDQCGKSHFYLGAKGNTGMGSLKPNFPTMERLEQEVEVVTLDNQMPPEVKDVTFIHVDTEGHDVKVLQGARRFIERQTQRPMIKLEFQPRSMQLHGSGVADLIAFMDEMKYGPLFYASGVLVPLSYSILMEMFYLWRGTLGWIDIILAPQPGK